MKIVIFSDSHGDIETMVQVVEKEKPEVIIHLGDGKADVEQLKAKYPSIPLHNVLGNVDSDKKDEEWIKFSEICGKRFVLVHGHLMINETKEPKQTDENRISSRNKMLKLIDEHDADILLHGHSHEAFMHRTKAISGKTCWIMNPGSISHEKNVIAKPIYGVLNISETGTFKWEFIEVE